MYFTGEGAIPPSPCAVLLSFQRKRQLEITNFSEVAYSKIAFSEMITPPLKELILAAFYHSQNSRGAT